MEDDDLAASEAAGVPGSPPGPHRSLGSPTGEGGSSQASSVASAPPSITPRMRGHSADEPDTDTPPPPPPPETGGAQETTAASVTLTAVVTTVTAASVNGTPVKRPLASTGQQTSVSKKEVRNQGLV